MAFMKPGQGHESIEQLIEASEGAEHTGTPMHILSEMLIRLANGSCCEDVYAIMGQALRKMVPDSVVIINSYDGTTGIMRVKALEGVDPFIVKITDLIGAHPLDISFTISDEAIAGLSSGKLEQVPGRLYDLTMGNIPRHICTAIEHLLDLTDVRAIGLNDRGELLGSANFLVRKSNTLNRKVVEAFIKLSSIVLRKSMVDEAERRSWQQNAETVQTINKFLQTSTDMIFSVDRDGRFLNTNNALSKELSYPGEELENRNLFEFIHPDDLDHTQGQISRVFQGKIIQLMDYHLKTRKGPYIFVSMSACPLANTTGEVIGVLGIARNISGKKKQAEKLRYEYSTLEQQLAEQARELGQANTRLKQELKERQIAQEEASRARKEVEYLLQSSPAIICRSDLKTKVLYVNKRFEEFTGYSSEEVEGRYWPALGLFPFDTGTLLRRMKEKLTNPSVKSMEVAVKCKNGEIKYVSGMGTVIFEKGRPIGFQVFAQDISERKDAEERADRSTGLLLKALEDMVEAMAYTVELRDPYTAGHQRRVAQLAFTIGAKLGLNDNLLVGIRLAGLVHDIGKIRVPAEILTHPDGLTTAEMSIIRTHPTVGYEIVKNIAFPWPIADAILQHHERLDGSGYPAGLKEKDIILEAKILAVADVVEAMASHRPYRPSLGIEKALDEIKTNRGILYDAGAVDCCVELFEKSGFIFGHSPIATY